MLLEKKLTFDKYNKTIIPYKQNCVKEILMELYFAPLEGITTKIYRNTHHEFFCGVDKYYSPFITLGENDKLTEKLLRDVLPEENKVELAVQILCNQKNTFVSFAKRIKELGYDEININLGCPSGTVVSKGRGSGFLRETEELDRFLDGIFTECDMNISVKTRIGFSTPDEMIKLTEIYNRYPISLLIVHPRLREDFYKGVPDMVTFKAVYETYKKPLCYNGDVITKVDFDRIKEEFPELFGVMIGRGAVKNPAIFREINGGKPLTNTELSEFLCALSEKYVSLLNSEVFTLHKLKEIMMSVMQNYPDDRKLLKSVKKANKLSDLIFVIKKLPEL